MKTGIVMRVHKSDDFVFLNIAIPTGGMDRIAVKITAQSMALTQGQQVQYEVLKAKKLWPYASHQPGELL